MARAKTNKLYRTFNRGLITEASPLTYPEDSSIDELNTVISRKGNRTRRVGIDYQDGFVLENLGMNPTVITKEFVWHSVNNDPQFNFVAIQVGNIVYFYRLDEGAVSANKLPFSIDLNAYRIAGANSDSVRKNYADFTSGSGWLFIAHKYCDPISVEYKKDTNTLDVIRIIIDVRDLEGIDDGLSNDEEPTQLSAEHHYNLRNQGWVAPSIKISGTGGGSVGLPTGLNGGNEGNIN